MIMVEGSDSDIVNIKFLLLYFEEMSGLKINFDKSERWWSLATLRLSSFRSRITSTVGCVIPHILLGECPWLAPGFW